MRAATSARAACYNPLMSKVALDGALARRPSREDAGAVARITTFHQPTAK